MLSKWKNIVRCGCSCLLTVCLLLPVGQVAASEITPDETVPDTGRYELSDDMDSNYHFWADDYETLIKEIQRVNKVSAKKAFKLTLHDDLVVEPIDSDSEAGIIFAHQSRWTIDGQGHTISKKDDRPNKTIVPVIRVFCNTIIRNVILDGADQFPVLSIGFQAELTLEGDAVLQHGYIEKQEHKGSAITAGTRAKVLMKPGVRIQHNRNSHPREHGNTVHLRQEAKADIDGVIFEDNSCAYDGAAIGVYELAQLHLKDSRFIGNQARNKGGAIDIKTQPPVPGKWVAHLHQIEHCIFEHNKASEGGAINNERYVRLKDCTFSHNEAKQGGALYLVRYHTDCEGNTFQDNHATESGGAMAIDPSDSRDADLNVKLLAGNRFIGNRADGPDGGGAIYMRDHQYADPLSEVKAYQKLQIEGSNIFTGNQAASGLFNPPSNGDAWTGWSFDPTSDVRHERLTRAGLLNNYDINYKNNRRVITYRADGGHFNDGHEERSEDQHTEGEPIKILQEIPLKADFKFKGWQDETGNLHQPGADWQVKEHQIFTAQWEPVQKPEPKPPVPSEPEPSKPSESNPLSGSRGRTRTTSFGDFSAPLQEPSKPKGGFDKTSTKPYIFGYVDQRFAPEQTITRAEMVALLSRLIQPSAAPVKAIAYQDVKATDWYYSGFIQLQRLGVVKGVEQHLFAPQRPLTRAELVAFLARIESLPQSNTVLYKDLSLNHWAATAIGDATKAGWVHGYPDGTFAPDQAITRAEAVSIINRVMQRHQHLNLNQALSASPFQDITPNHWAYQDILIAAVDLSR